MDLTLEISKEKRGLCLVRFKGPFVPLILIFLNQIVTKTLEKVIELTTSRSKLLIMEQPWTFLMTLCNGIKEVWNAWSWGSVAESNRIKENTSYFWELILWNKAFMIVSNTRTDEVVLILFFILVKQNFENKVCYHISFFHYQNTDLLSVIVDSSYATTQG